MPGMSSGGESVSGESWFALNKDEFYVILDSVLTEMTKCEERNNVSGCIELIKLLSDNGTTDDAKDKLSTCDGSGDTNLSVRPNSNQSGNNSSGCLGKYETNGKRPNFHKSSVSCRTNGTTSSGDYTQLSIRSGVDRMRHLNKGNVLSSARHPGNHRDRVMSRLQRPGLGSSKEFFHGRKTSLSGKTRDIVKTSLFHPSRISATASDELHKNIYSNSMRNDNQNSFTAKLSTASRHQRQHAKVHELRHQNKSKPLSSGLHHDAQISSNRPDTEHRRHQSSQTSSAVCAKMKAQRNTTESNTRYKPVLDEAEDEMSSSKKNPVDRHITESRQLELRSQTPCKLTSTADRSFLSATTKAPNNKWTPVDKTVINNILDDILSSDDSHSSLQTRNNNDVDMGNDDVSRTADEFLLHNDVKVENENDVTTDDMKTANHLGNNGVIAKLVDVRRFDVDVSQMSFKWKSQLLWRMRHDKVSQTPMTSLCLS